MPKRDNAPKQPSKGKIIDDLCKTLNISDYTALPNIISQVLAAATSPIWGITITWKPDVRGSLAYNTVGVPSTPQGFHVAARTCMAVGQQLNERALLAATQAQQEPGADDAAPSASVPPHAERQQPDED